MNYIKKLMEDNGIEKNEEFYVINEEGEKIQQFTEERKKYQKKFYFNEYMGLMSEGCVGSYDRILRELMSGECKIEKIPQKPKTVWDLKEEEDYYYIDMCGDVDITAFRNGTYLTDEKIIKIGNAFLTKEEAKHEVERRKCEAILLKYGTRDMMSISDDDTNKYFICYNNYVHGIAVNNNQFVQNQGTIYFKTKELAQKAIEECGKDRLKKYVFNVKE